MGARAVLGLFRVGRALRACDHRGGDYRGLAVKEVVLGIVGHEAAKFTAETEQAARNSIHWAIEYFEATKVVSGRCHLGGIDIWAIEEARALGLEVEEFPPKNLRWFDGYRERNIAIAENSDAVVCIVVKQYPQGYKGMRFDYCYHCGTNVHVKSGGCWTVKHARRLHRQTRVIEI